MEILNEIFTSKFLSMKHLFFYSILFFSFFFNACTQSTQKTRSGKLKIVCTTGMIADALSNIAGDSAEVMAIMGAGVDPHLYKATQGDLEKLTNADIIFYNGLHLEGKMGEILEKLARQKTVVPIAEGIAPSKLRLIDEVSKTYDPHIWFDAQLWKAGVQYASQKLQAADPAQKDFYEKNTEKYTLELDSLDKEVRQKISEIPEKNRVLITSHDAFGYYGQAYGIKVRGLQGISTVADFGLNDVTELVKFIIENEVKAMFFESSVSDKSIKAVLEGCLQKNKSVMIGGELFSDAMGAPRTPEGTYLGMVRANTNTIVKALK